MTTYIVTYDLRKPGRNYGDLYNYLKSFGSWCKITESTWAVVTSSSSVEVRDGISRVVDSGDVYAVISSGSSGAWAGTGSEVTDWLKKYL